MRLATPRRPPLPLPGPKQLYSRASVEAARSVCPGQCRHMRQPVAEGMLWGRGGFGTQGATARVRGTERPGSHLPAAGQPALRPAPAWRAW